MPKCSICAKTFEKPYQLRIHQRLHGSKPFQCTDCGQRFGLSHVLSRHEKIHIGDQPHACRFCDKTFVQKTHLVAHERRHTGDKPYKCQFCEKTFVQAESQKKHEATHTGDRPFLCSICGKGYATKSSMSDHERKHSGTVKAKTPLSTLKPKFSKSKPKSHECNICGKVIIGGLAAHKRVHTGEKPYACNVCGKSYQRASHRNYHQSIHSGNYTSCQHCGKMFNRKDYLLAHIRKHHQKD